MPKVKVTKDKLYELTKKYFPEKVPALKEMEYKRYKGTAWLNFVDEEGRFCRVVYDSAPAFKKNLWIYCNDLTLDKVIKLQEDDFKVSEEKKEVTRIKTTVTVVNESNECIGHYNDSLEDNHEIQKLMKDKTLIQRSEKIVNHVKYILLVVQSKVQKEGEKSYEQSCVSRSSYKRSRSEVFAG